MKLRIVSDGTSHGTRVEDAATGELLERVRSVTWEVTAHDGPATAVVEVLSPQLDAYAEQIEEEEGMGTEPEGGFDLTTGYFLLGFLVGFVVAAVGVGLYVAL